MKKVLLLGDSIRQLGYGNLVPELLGKDYEVCQPDDNCRFIKYTLRMLFDKYQEFKDSDVIHWNNGLWDICRIFDDKKTFTSEAEYLENSLRVAKILTDITPKVIFATTTPVRKENPYNSNEDIDRYNAILVPELTKMGIEINDLNALLKDDIERYICDDLIHLTEEGKEVCAKQVARYIKSVE